MSASPALTSLPSTPHDVDALERRLEDGRQLALTLHGALAEVVLGQEETLAQVVTCLLAGGHVLLEGAPGLGKTQIVRTLARLIGGRFSRIQFTPDLMPSDVLGTSLVETDADGQRGFRYREGPIFANLVLADEINRATPKTQSALLEAMAERTVSVEGVSRALPDPFFVLATENPIEMEGVYPLPEAQLDRFLMKLVLGMPSLETLTEIGTRVRTPEPTEAVTSPRALGDAQAAAREVVATPALARYAARLVLATHTPPEVRYGAGPRAVQALMACARVRAMVAGRAALGAADLDRVAPSVLAHRMVLGFEAEAEGLSAERLVEEALRGVELDA
ncbi:MAG: AAA family ATPase [Sandaracinaceae bacterium]